MIHSAFATHQRARWMRPDAARFLRPDAAKFLKAGSDPTDVYPALGAQRDRARRAFDNALADERNVLDGMRRDLAQVKSDLAWRGLLRAMARKYSPNQPRVPAGESGGGQWTSGGSGRPRIHIYRSNPDDDSAVDGGDLSEIVVDGTDWANSTPSFDAPGNERNATRSVDILNSDNAGEESARVVRIGSRPKVVLDEFGEPYYRPKGHHEMPRSLYEKMDLTPETRQVFQRSTTGRLPPGLTIGSDGKLRGHYWDEEHRKYNKAVEELRDKFFRDHDIMEERRMTPSHAEDLLSEIRTSKNPAIRDYNASMRSMARMFRLFRPHRGE